MSLAFASPLVLLGLLALPLLVLSALRGVAPERRRRRIVAVAVRGAIVALLIVALASPAIVRQSDRLATIFLVDASDSVGPAGVTAAHDYVKAALTHLPPGDTAGVVVFGDNALVERSVSDDPDLGPLLSHPDTGHSDLAGAVRLGLALFPEGRMRRLVLISDGQENKGDLIAAASAAAASGAQLSTHTLPAASGDEALVSEIQAPARAREGEAIDLKVTVQSTRAQPAQLRVFADGDLLREQIVNLRAGSTTFALTVSQPGSGFHRFRAEITATTDTHWQNNAASAFTDVKGRARVLILEGIAGEGANLAAALTATGFQVDTLSAVGMPATLAELVPYDAVLIVDVPAEALGGRATLLQSYVRDLGRGLIAVGGERAYGPGGYAGTPLEDLLPVRMDLRNGVVNPPVSLVFAIDKSGSMNDVGSGAAGAVSKLDLAKEAVFRAIKLLQPGDQVGIVAFDTAASWVAPLKPLSEQPDIVNRLGSLRAEGGTEIAAGLDAAVQAQLASSGRVRHIILLTDGQSPNNFGDLIRRMTDAGITLSVIGVGQDAAPYLPQLAAAGGGRYYFASDPAQLPEIFLKETRLALRSYFIEGDIAPRFAAPSPIVEGLDGVPTLRGYVGTTAKPTALTPLVSGDGDPLLAQWQYGLGRAVAWTSDAKGQWTTSWLSWSEFARFWSRAVGWTIAAPAQQLQLSTRIDGGRTLVTVDALDPAGGYRNGLSVAATIIAPDGTRREVAFQQVAPGRYGGDLGTLQEGAHLLVVVARDAAGNPQAATSGGVIVPYSPEYALPRTDRSTLARARELTGGSELNDPAEAFAHTLPPARQSRTIWPALVIVAILLWPLDIAIRRLLVGPRDLRAAFKYLGTMLRHPAAAAAGPPTVKQGGAGSGTTTELLAARQRLRDRWATGATEPNQEPPAPRAAPDERSPTVRPAPPRVPVQTREPGEVQAWSVRPAPSPPTTVKGDGTLGQLLRAKDAARRRTGR